MLSTERSTNTEGKTSKKDNKPGYTATCCGRVGRGGNVRFLLFNSSVTDQPTNQPTDRPTDGWTKPLIELCVRN